MGPSDFLFRRALRADLPDIVRMLAEDSLGATREEASSPLPESYYTAFDTPFYESLGFVASHEGLKLGL